MSSLQYKCMNSKMRVSDINRYLKYCSCVGFNVLILISDSTVIDASFVFRGSKCVFELQLIAGGDDSSEWYVLKDKLESNIFTDFTPKGIRKAILGSQYGKDMVDLWGDEFSEDQMIRIKYDLLTQYNVLRSSKACGGGNIQTDSEASKYIKERLLKDTHLYHISLAVHGIVIDSDSKDVDSLFPELLQKM